MSKYYKVLAKTVPGHTEHLHFSKPKEQKDGAKKARVSARKKKKAARRKNR